MAIALFALSVLVACGAQDGGESTVSSATATSSGPPADVVAMREMYNDDVLRYNCNQLNPGLAKAQCVGTSLNRLEAIQASAAGLSPSASRTQIIQSIDTWKNTRDQYADNKCYWLNHPVQSPVDATSCVALEQSLYDQWIGVLTAMGW
ncbi:tail assembly chaperone [Gordonia phage Birdsong]|nr:hypothetical protein SEA_BEARBQ_16 [Gordonia phage BearBQ]